MAKNKKQELEYITIEQFQEGLEQYHSEYVSTLEQRIMYIEQNPPQYPKKTFEDSFRLGFQNILETLPEHVALIIIGLLISTIIGTEVMTWVLSSQ